RHTRFSRDWSSDVCSSDLPGFINFHLAAGAWQREVAGVLRHGSEYGRNTTGQGRTAGVEYVSANPTGPLHVGHGRAAAIGDCIEIGRASCREGGEVAVGDG